jgi:hypothetical protein
MLRVGNAYSLKVVISGGGAVVRYLLNTCGVEKTM